MRGSYLIFSFFLIGIVSVTSFSLSSLSSSRINLGRRSRCHSGEIRSGRGMLSMDLLGFDNVYTQFLENNGLLADMGTVFISNSVSDCLAQFSEKQRLIDGIIKPEDPVTLEIGSSTESMTILDFDRTKRFAFFGFLDGAVGHTWFIVLDKVIKGNDGISVVYKIIADTLVFTPLWCAWFILAMGLLEGSLKQKIDGKTIGKEYGELLYIDVGFFLPLSTVVYSVVPREARVLVFSIANLVYTSIVSLWNQKKRISVS